MEEMIEADVIQIECKMADDEMVNWQMILPLTPCDLYTPYLFIKSIQKG
jgi:hypothetical protein